MVSDMGIPQPQCVASSAPWLTSPMWAWVFPLWIVGHAIFSLYLLQKALTSYKSKSYLPKLFHIGSFVMAFIGGTISMLSLIHDHPAPSATVLSVVGFALNALVGLFLLPFIHFHWVVWKRLIFIGATFNIISAAIVYVLIYPSPDLPLTNLSFSIFQFGVIWLCIATISELILFILQCLFPLSMLYQWLPKIENTWSFPWNYFHIFCCPGELPWKNFGVSIIGIRLILLVTLYFSYQWIQVDLIESIGQLSEKVRMTAVMIVITSAWANAISVFAPTMLYRGLMSRTPAVLIYVLFAFPAPQISSLLIVFHPSFFGNCCSFSDKAEILMYAASYGYLPKPVLASTGCSM